MPATRTSPSSPSSLEPIRAALVAPWVRWLCLLAVCGAYIQGGLDKVFDFPSAIAEMQHFGVAPAAPFAFATICLELVASLMILIGFYRWLAAGALAVFTLMTLFIASNFWTMSGAERAMTENVFFEHIGLIGAFLLIAWHDLRRQTS